MGFNKPSNIVSSNTTSYLNAQNQISTQSSLNNLEKALKLGLGERENN